MTTIQVNINLHRKGFALDVTMAVPGSGITALFGASGSGKTSVLRCIAGLERAEGKIIVNGETWQDANTFLPTHRRALGYVFQEPSLFPHLNVRGNLEYGYRRQTQRHVNFAQTVALLGLEPLLARRPEQLSGGQKQRVAIARALLTQPRLLLMDEPLASLDLDSKAEILPYLEQLHDELNIPVLYVSHAPAEVVRLADHLVLLEQGRVHACGPINELLTDNKLPLAHFDEAGAVLHGRVKQQDESYHLTYVAIPGGTVAVSHKALPLGHPVRVRILARDVSLALTPSEHSSITNVLPTRVVAVHPTTDPAQALVTLDVGGEQILSRITRRSVAYLNIRPDQILYAQVKSVALMR